MVPGKTAMVLVALAATGLKTARSAGKVKRVPPPAIELTAPAAKALAQRPSWSQNSEVNSLSYTQSARSVSAGSMEAARRAGQRPKNSAATE